MRGHGIHRGTSGALSVGLRLLWPWRVTTVHYWHLLVGLGITWSSQRRKISLKLLCCSKGLHACVRYWLLLLSLLPFHVSSHFSSVCLHLLPPFDCLFFFLLFFLPFRQNPVPEESCARRGHEAAAFHRRLLQGKEALLSTSFYSPYDSRECPPACEGSKVTAHTALSHALNMGHETYAQLRTWKVYRESSQ